MQLIIWTAGATVTNHTNIQQVETRIDFFMFPADLFYNLYRDWTNLSSAPICKSEFDVKRVHTGAFWLQEIALSFLSNNDYSLPPSEFAECRVASDKLWETRSNTWTSHHK